jgi:MOSC domain-containing protein YiiM
MKPSLRDLLDSAPRPGRLEWIGLRVAHRGAVVPVQCAAALAGRGLEGDHRSGRSGGERQVTLIQAEHLNVIASLTGQAAIEPARLRRNLVVSGINLLALRDKEIWVGEARLRVAGPCHPCSRMEQALGPGGYHALRGHGGVTAEVVESGRVQIGDAVRLAE